MSAEKYGMVLRQVLQAAELERLFDGLLPPRPSHWLGRPSSDACFVPRAVEPVEMTIAPSRSDQVPLFVQQFFMQVRHRGSRQTKRGRGGRDQHRNAPTRVADEPVTETCCNSGFPIPGEQRTRNAIAARSRAQTGYGLVEKSAMLGDRRAVRPRQKGLCRHSANLGRVALALETSIPSSLRSPRLRHRYWRGKKRVGQCQRHPGG